jgi:hypothetical protein
MQDLSKIRLELATYTSEITIFINTLSLGSKGKIEEYMTAQGGELRRMRRSLNWITASLQATNGGRDGSVLTSYTDDDTTIWKDFRRELIKDGYTSTFLQANKEIIHNYSHQLGHSGTLDEPTGYEQCFVEEDVQIHEGATSSGDYAEESLERRVWLPEI